MKLSPMPVSLLGSGDFLFVCVFRMSMPPMARRKVSRASSVVASALEARLMLALRFDLCGGSDARW